MLPTEKGYPIPRAGYEITRSRGGLAGTRRTVREIKRNIIDGGRAWTVRRKAMEIVHQVPSRDRSGEIKALWNWVTSTSFREDPVNLELLVTPQRQLAEIRQGYGFGVDCDDYVMLLGALARSIGIPVRLVLIGEESPDLYSHIYLELYDRDIDDWVPADAAVPGKPLGWSYPSPATKWVETFNESDEFAGPWPRDGQTMQLSGIGGRAGRRVARVLDRLGQLDVGGRAGADFGRQDQTDLSIEGDTSLEALPGTGIDIDEDGSGLDIDVGDEDDEGLNLCMDPDDNDPWCQNIDSDEDDPLDWDIDIDEDSDDDVIGVVTDDDEGGIDIGFDDDDAADPGYDLDMSQMIEDDEDEDAGDVWIDIDQTQALPADVIDSIVEAIQDRDLGDRDTVSVFASFMIMSLVFIERELQSGDSARIEVAQKVLNGLNDPQTLSGLIDRLRKIKIGKWRPVDWALDKVNKVFDLIEKILGPEIGGFINGVIKLTLSNIAQVYGGPVGRYFADILLYELDGGMDWLELQWDRITLIAGPIIDGLTADSGTIDIDEETLEALERDIENAKKVLEDFIAEFKKGMKQQIKLLRESYEDAREEMEQAFKEGKKAASAAFSEMQDLRKAAEDQLAEWRETAEEGLKGIQDRFGRLLEARNWLEATTEEILRQADTAISLESFDDYMRTEEFMADLQRQVDLGTLDPRDAFKKLDAFEKELYAETDKRIKEIESQANEAIKEAERIHEEAVAAAEKLRKDIAEQLQIAFSKTGKAATDAMVKYVGLVGTTGLEGLSEITLANEGITLFDKMRAQGIDIAKVQAAAIQFELAAIMDIEISVITAMIGEEALVAATRFQSLPPDEQQELNELAERLRREGILDENGNRIGTRIREDSADAFSKRREGKLGEGLDLTMDQMVRGAQPDYPPPLGPEPDEVLSAGDTGLIPAGGVSRESFFQRHKVLITVGAVAAATAGAVAVSRRK